MRKQPTIVLLLVGCVLFLSAGFPAVSATSEIRDKEYTFELSRESNVWSDTQWKFFKVTLNYSDTLNVSASMSGDLDVDLRLYSNDKPDQVSPWDITREGMKDLPYKQNSQLRGSDKDEILGYTNEFSINGELLYLLVYVFSGTGNSTVTLHSNLPLEEVKPEIGGFEAFFKSNFYYIAGAVVAVFVVVIILTVKRVKKVKRKMAEQKLAVDEKPEPK
ncbi:MAG: hypothetical protein ACTSU5_09480 [Promethearchaeota archaeon]